MAKTVIVEVQMAVLGTIAAMLLLAGSNLRLFVTTATRDAARAVNLPQPALFVVVVPALAIQKRPAQVMMAIVQLMRLPKMAPIVATTFNVPVVNVPAAISNAGL